MIRERKEEEFVFAESAKSAKDFSFAEARHYLKKRQGNADVVGAVDVCDNIEGAERFEDKPGVGAERGGKGREAEPEVGGAIVVDHRGASEENTNRGTRR
jgi:hypothetical protein